MSVRPRSRPRPPAWPGTEPPPAIGERTSRLLRGGASGGLRDLGDGCAQAIITSPPYWGLRDYGVEPSVWGGEEGCRHRWRTALGGRVCSRCRAWKGSLGQEGTPGLYVAHLVGVLREARRCLRPDGTLWLVLGDSFASHRHREIRHEGVDLKPKDLVGIPWEVALALRADGWWLRSDCVWAKPNVMPESVFDRPTRAHEYVFLLSRSARYFYDWFAVREPDQGRRSGNGFVRPSRRSYGGREAPRGSSREWVGGGGRNRRTVWNLASQCFAGGHFATFPEALVEVCLRAGSSPVSCRRCGAPWRRVVESVRLLDGEREVSGSWTRDALRRRSGRSMLPTGYAARRVEIRRRTAGWDPSCAHLDPGGRSTILDPFAGTATTGLVAGRHGRDFVGIELSAEYADMARDRLTSAGVQLEIEDGGA